MNLSIVNFIYPERKTDAKYKFLMKKEKLNIWMCKKNKYIINLNKDQVANFMLIH